MNAKPQPHEASPPAVIAHPAIDVPTMLRAQAIRMDAIERRLLAGDERMGKIEQDLKINTEATQRIETNTRELVDAFKNFQGAKRTLKVAGELASPVTKLIALGSAVGGAVAAWFHWGAPPR